MSAAPSNTADRLRSVSPRQVTALSVARSVTNNLAGWRYNPAVSPATLTELDVSAGQAPWVLKCAVSGGGLAINGVVQTGDNPVMNLDAPITTEEGQVFELITIKHGAFSDAATIHQVIMPDTLTTIEYNAFYNCRYMTSLRLPERLETLGNTAFRKCVRLKTVENFLPATLTSIGNNAFQECTHLTTPVIFGHGVDAGNRPIAVTLGAHAFNAAKALPSVTIGPGVTAIPNEVFTGCTSLKTVRLHDAIISLGFATFKDCTSLETVSPLTPSALTTLSASVFSGCPLLAGEAVLGTNGVCTIGADAFKGTSISRLDLGPGVTGPIPTSFCQGCNLLSDVTLEGNLTAISKYAFNGCSALESIIMPDSITKIEGESFTGCTSLESVRLPESLTTIGNSAFLGCSALAMVEPLLPTECTFIGNSVFENCPMLSGALAIATNGAAATIGTSAFKGTEISSVTLGCAIERIGDSAFRSCTSLRHVRLPAGLTRIDNYALSGCTALEVVEPLLPAGCTNVGNEVFSNCLNLQGELFFATNGAAASIGSSAFYRSKISAATLGDAIAQIGASAFKECSSLHSIRLPATLVAIGDSAFTSCTSLEYVSPLLPATCTSIGASAFSSCTALTGDLVVDGGGNGVSLGSYAFLNSCIGSASFSAGVTSIPGSFLGNVQTLKTVTFASKPTWTSSSFYQPPAYASRFIVPADNVAWAEFVANPTLATPWDALDASVRQSYIDAYPGEPPPRAITKSAPANQWIVSYGQTPAGNIDLAVTGAPAQIGAGQVAPAYGYYADIAATQNLPMSLSAPQYANEAEARYACVGYRIERPSLGGWTDAVDHGLDDPTTPVVSYVPDGDGQRRFSWLWEPVEYAVTVWSPNDPSIGQAFVSGAGMNGYFTPGATATATATPGIGLSFVRWHGDVPAGHETDPTISFVVDAPKRLVPEFSSAWTYDSVAKTVTDGYWTLKVTGSQDALTVGKPTANGDSPIGVLDLRKPIAGGGAFVSIANSAFEANGKLAVLRLPDTLESIGNNSFNKCTSLTTIEPFFPNSLTSIGQWCFRSCAALEGDLKFALDGRPASLNGGYNFHGTRISSVTLGDGVTLNSERIFSSNTSLGSVRLGEGIRSIGTGMFSGCSSLTNVTPFLPVATIAIGTECFYGCSLLEGELYFATNGAPATLGSSSFCGTGISSVNCGNGVTSIPDKAFYNCKLLGDVKIGEGVASLGGYGFNSCTALTNFCPLLPASVASIGDACFYGCSSLVGDLHVGTNGIPVQFGGANTFNGCKAITSATLGNGVTALPSNAFQDCKSLTWINASETMGSVGGSCFRYCDSLTSFDPFLPAGMSSVGSRAFFDLKKLTGTLVVGMARNDVVFVASENFCGTAITNLILGPRLVSMSNGAFKNATKLAAITINSTSAISANAFNGCTKVRAVYFDGPVPLEMPASAFTGWKAGQSCLHIPKDNVTWRAWLDANIIPWDDLTDDEHDSYWDEWPNGKKPYGFTKTTSVPASQWVAGWVSPGLGTIIILQ